MERSLHATDITRQLEDLLLAAAVDIRRVVLLETGGKSRS